MQSVRLVASSLYKQSVRDMSRYHLSKDVVWRLVSNTEDRYSQMRITRIHNENSLASKASIFSGAGRLDTLIKVEKGKIYECNQSRGVYEPRLAMSAVF